MSRDDDAGSRDGNRSGLSLSIDWRQLGAPYRKQCDGDGERDEGRPQQQCKREHGQRHCDRDDTDHRLRRGEHDGGSERDAPRQREHQRRIRGHSVTYRRTIT